MFDDFDNGHGLIIRNDLFFVLEEQTVEDKIFPTENLHSVKVHCKILKML